MTPDAAVKKYRRMYERLTAPGSVDPERDRGDVWEPMCRTCFSDDFTDGGKGVEGARCEHCGTRRRKFTERLMKNEVQEPRRRLGKLSAVEELVLLGSVLVRAKKWPLRAIWVYTFDATSYTDAASICRERWPRHRKKWTRDYVWSLVKTARRRIGVALEEME
jgi:hypothetical protein